MLTFVSKCFLKSLWKRETQLSIFWKILTWTVKIFIDKPPCFLEFIVLIFWFISIFQKNENRFISLVLKAKQQKAIQLSCIFLKFYINQSSNKFLLFLHFPGLWNLNSFMWRVVSMLFFILHESGLNLLSSI